MSARLSIDEWTRIGRVLTAAADSATWWLGDWLVFGQDRYPERYRRKIRPGRRRPGLSMQHHAEVASLTPSVQDEWLERAEKNAWSRNELRRRIRHTASAAEAQPAAAMELRLTVPHARRQNWEDAAERANCELNEWVLGVLDAAARNSAEAPEHLHVVEAG
ncbi:hypothetical protein ACWGI8_34365 [Streptomyces sp. NPDC054841]